MPEHRHPDHGVQAHGLSQHKEKGRHHVHAARLQGHGSHNPLPGLNYPEHLIELQLAHIDINKVRAAYNRMTPRSWFNVRREILQKYANYQDDLRIGKNNYKKSMERLCFLQKIKR